jgi:hypothetical protein
MIAPDEAGRLSVLSFEVYEWHRKQLNNAVGYEPVLVRLANVCIGVYVFSLVYGWMVKRNSGKVSLWTGLTNAKTYGASGGNPPSL